jgi:hypothetical protein
MTALERLPLVMAALDKQIRPHESITSMVWVDGPCHGCETAARLPAQLLALRNALPGLIEMARGWAKMKRWYVAEDEDLAQRILDAIQQAVTPETWAEMNKEAQE